jgi:hypothetical protein
VPTCLVEIILRLRSQGHSISVVDNTVSVAPAVHEDTLWLLDSMWSDVAAVLGQFRFLHVDVAEFERFLAEKLKAL